MRQAWPEGADLTLECAGVAETVAEARALTRAGGRVVVLGVLPRGERVPIEPFDLLVREIQLHFSYINPFTQTRAAELIASGRVAVEPLISRSIPLAEAVETIANPARAGEVKVVVIPARLRTKETPMPHPALVPDAVAVVTGGASGIGLAAATALRRGRAQGLHRRPRRRAAGAAAATHRRRAPARRDGGDGGGDRRRPAVDQVAGAGGGGRPSAGAAPTS